jgi:phospholipid transport system substrate-binding protein
MAFHRLKTASAALLTGVLIAFSGAPQQVLAQASPQTITAQNVVVQFHAILVNVMKEGENLGYEGRYQWLAPAVTETFNLPFMAEIAAGIYWAKATDEERKRYVEAFSKMSTATYAARFDGFSGEKFDILSTDQEGQSSVVVRSKITGSDGVRTDISYLMRQFGGGWKVVDVYLNGSVSELAVKKSDYSSVLKTGGMDALITALDEKVAGIARDETRSAAKRP